MSQMAIPLASNQVLHYLDEEPAHARVQSLSGNTCVEKYPGGGLRSRWCCYCDGWERNAFIER